MTEVVKEIIILALLLVYASIEAYAHKEKDWMLCNEAVPGCVCKWVSGKKTANCQNASFSDVPRGLSDEIQSLVLDETRITTLRNEAFKSAELVNLHKISMKNCHIREIEKYAFVGLGIVIEIDLTGNNIRKLEPPLFAPTEKLRQVYLNSNSIEKLDDGLFVNMKFLQTVELEDNQISYIGTKAFDNIPLLKNVKLNGNKLSHLKKHIFDKFGGSLKSLELKNNPWKCDCHLRDFMMWYTERLYTDPTTCYEPEYLANTPWKAIEPEQFACRPDILWPSPDAVFEANTDQLTLACKVVGDPKPEAYWTFNSRPIGNRTVVGPTLSDRKYIDFHSEDNAFWVNVTISKMNRQDHGTYSCVAKNPAGIIERNVTVSGQSGSVQIFGFARTNIGDVWVLLLCLFIGIVCALILIFMLCFLCCRRAETIVAKKPPNNSITANGDVTHHIVMEPEQQKTLLTAVNPVQKPPRKYDSSPQSDSGGAEMTELNRNLLDDTSVLGGTSVAGDSIEERRSTNSVDQLSSYNSQDNLLLERLRPLNRSHHPPDLLAFPNRRTQGSPAGSVVSNDPDNSRFRAIHSPVRSPIYQMHQYAPSYETLPYSRTQSPFSPTSLTPVIQHRQGYVTIPRRPRVPSWSSAPTPTIEEALTKAEPVYDNLGPRTTADGSSVLSLTRKVADSSPNMRTRPLPPAPLYSSHTLPHKSKLNHVYLAIRENEEPKFRPVVQNGGAGTENRGVIRPLPLQYSPSNETPPVHDKKRASWATRQVPETGTLKKTVSNDLSPTKSISPGIPAANNTSTPSRSQKVPPKPPPKPKKTGPLFEDEGEDGTEV